MLKGEEEEDVGEQQKNLSDWFNFVSTNVEQVSHDGVYLLGNERKISIPQNSMDARCSVLNSLRTILPCMCMLRLTDVADVVDIDMEVKDFDYFFIIQDFYYKETELHMMVIDLKSFTLFDAFAIREDLFHMYVTKSKLKPTTKFQSFAGFYMRTPQLEWLTMNRTLCSALKTCKYNESLHNWLTNKDSLLNAFKLESPPESWRPFPEHYASYLFCSPTLSNCNLQSSCLCQRPGPWSICDIKTSCDYSLIEYVQPTILALKSFAMKSSDVKPQLKSKKRKHSFNSKGERLKCLFHKECKEPATCFWVSCCQATHPVACKKHTKAAMKPEDINSRISRCPKHKLSSRVASILF